MVRLETSTRSVDDVRPLGMLIEELYDVLIWLAIPLPLAAGIALGLIALTHRLTTDVNPLSRGVLRSLVLLTGGACVLTNTATSVLWWWSWRYFEDPNGPPAGLEKAQDLGILVGGLVLIVPSCVAAVALLIKAHARSRARGTVEHHARG